MSNGEGWHRNDRCLHKPSEQRGIVQGWKNGKLYIYWGTNNNQRAESWVNDEDCVWEPHPVEVLDAKGGYMGTVQDGVRPASNSPVVTPTPLALPEVVRKGGCDLSKYRL